MRVAALAFLLLAGSASAQTLPPASDAAPVMAPGAQSVTPPPAIPETWLPMGVADLVGLDKITTRLTKFSVKLGETASFGSLRITLRACSVRGPNQPADQAAFLDITDVRHKDFAFHSWMLLSDPAVAVVEHPVYDVTLAGCR